ncbi:hypothetical protein N7495_007836 [Penicillium taxi]|uniref:uncharacterized protein n=1 Tax=Penicillium taxi TaxID=168475 RepID=UPI002544D5A1|nr:uncharacterized protein N7495_007836 [Penicillium taxi]KAJ5887795.1 hypothetical protein N7495_007836 [Penicillium taxi]
MKLQSFLILSYVLGAAASSIQNPPKRCSGNTANTRQKWCDYDIHTDYNEVVPNTGVTREYWLSLNEVTVSPDGVARSAMAVNGSIPGPTIFADWGDNVIVHVTNNLTTSHNGTSVHWHGMRQNYTNQNDGVTAITQCPTAPGSSYTYRWRAVQYGSSWYHAHIGLQAWEGVFGGINIAGPASANYDVDLGLMFLNDWSHQTVDELYHHAETVGPPTLDNGLINGTNVWNATANSTVTGSRYTRRATKGKSYRIRLVNAAIDTHWKFMIDNHLLTVIAIDLVPIKPYTTDFVDIAMGQRYDVIVTANQHKVAKNFWIRAIPQTACSENLSVNNIKGIFHYDSNIRAPTTKPYIFVDGCVDEDLKKLVPVVPKTVEAADWQALTDVTIAKNSNNLFKWYLNSTSLDVEWSDPTLLQVYNGVTDFSNSSGVIEVPNPNEWVYLLINTTLPIPHPVHLHGHDFFVLGQGTGSWDGTVNTANPPRRDTALLPASGHLLIAFVTDNPGTWLMHCHIGWHTAEGFALQWVERYNEIKRLVDPNAMDQNCAAWNKYDAQFNVQQEDSGV